MSSGTMVFYGLLTLLITSREFLLLRMLLPREFFHIALMGAFGIYWAGLLCRYDPINGDLVFKGKLNWPKFPGRTPVIIMASVLALYLILHETLFNDYLISLKYSVYLLFFISLLSTNVDLKRAATFISWFSATIACMAVVQQFLIWIVLDYDLAGYELWSPDLVDGRTDQKYVSPFMLGLVSTRDFAEYEILKLYRACSFTSEPKAFASLLWTGLVSTFYIYPLKSPRGVFLTVAISLGLFVCHAYTSLAIAACSLIFLALARLRLTYTGFAICTALLIIPISLAPQISDSLGGFAGARVASFQRSIVDRANGDSLEAVGGFGDGFDPKSRHSSLVVNFVRYGWLGMLLPLLLLARVCVGCLENMQLIGKDSRQLAMATAAGVSLAYFAIFEPELFTPSYAFVFALALRGNFELTKIERGNLAYV